MGNQYNSNSVAPGWPVLLATTAYTAICITIGFLSFAVRRSGETRTNIPNQGLAMTANLDPLVLTLHRLG